MRRQRVVNRVKLILPSAKVNKPANSSDQAQQCIRHFLLVKHVFFILITGILLPTASSYQFLHVKRGSFINVRKK